jgi:hypothetical protein
MQVIQIALKLSDGGMQLLDEMNADPRGRPGLWRGLNTRIPGRREPGECRLVRRVSLCYSTVRGLRVSKTASSFPCPVARLKLPD